MDSRRKDRRKEDEMAEKFAAEPKEKDAEPKLERKIVHVDGHREIHLFKDGKFVKKERG